MRLRYRIAPPLIAITLALAFSPALAERGVPVPVPGQLPALENHSSGGSCVLGQTGATQAFVWFFPSDDYYYTFVDFSQCGCSAGVDGLVAHWALFWPTQCSINVQAWIVKAVDTGGGCYAPDAGTDPPDPTSTETLCGPTPVFTITGSGLVDHSVPLPPCACLSGPAFILFKIVNNINCPESGGALSSPAIVVDSSADPCVSYNGFLGGPPAEMPSAFGFPGNTTMFVDATCCDPTPTLPGSWGQLKTIYR